METPLGFPANFATLVALFDFSPLMPEQTFYIHNFPSARKFKNLYKSMILPLTFRFLMTLWVSQQ
jgi:hypothetical protein